LYLSIYLEQQCLPPPPLPPPLLSPPLLPPLPDLQVLTPSSTIHHK
jgi:hypothetical protein